MNWRNALLTIIGALVSEIGAYVLWTVLSLPYAVVALIVLAILWLAIYFIRKPPQSVGETRREKSEHSQSTNENQSEVFGTEIFPTEGLRRDDLITFRVRFTGTFKRVYLQGEVKLADGWHSFPNYKTRSRSGWYSKGWFSKGKLNGTYHGEPFEWKGRIPKTISPGEYTFRIRGYERPPYTHWVAFRLRGLLFLKETGIIRSIDTSVLDYHEWEVVHLGQERKVVISS